MTLIEARKNQIKDLEDQIKGLKAKLRLIEDSYTTLAEMVVDRDCETCINDTVCASCKDLSKHVHKGQAALDEAQAALRIVQSKYPGAYYQGAVARLAELLGVK